RLKSNTELLCIITFGAARYGPAANRAGSGKNVGRRPGMSVAAKVPATLMSAEEIGALLHIVGRAPGRDRHGRSRILRRAFDQLVAVGHVHQDVPPGVASPD